MNFGCRGDDPQMDSDVRRNNEEVWNMVRGSHQVRVGLAIAALSLVGLTGCSSPASTGPSLADTKSPVQLLRNEAASRIPPAVIESVSDTEDLSVSCRSESEDPEGLRRSWHSNVEVTLERGSAWRVDQVVDEVGQSFVDQGWVMTPLKARERTHAIELTREGSTSEIRVSSHRPDPDAEPLASDLTDPITISLELHGPCVDTEGADSDAVRKLEAQD